MRTFQIDINKNKLLDYGFKLLNDVYYYEENIIDSKFKVLIEINKNMISKVIDNKTNEEYLMVDVKNATGNYVGMIREAYEKVLNNTILAITNAHQHSNKLIMIIKYIKDNYHDKPEYLWNKTPNTAVIRNKNNNKWYFLVMQISASKLGLNNENEIEIINLRYQKNKTNEIIDNINIFPAWHMNKSSWISINLNSNLALEIIYSLIDNSYELTKK